MATAHSTVSVGVILAVMTQCASLAPQPTARRAWLVQAWRVATWGWASNAPTEPWKFAAA